MRPSVRRLITGLSSSRRAIQQPMNATSHTAMKTPSGRRLLSGGRATGRMMEGSTDGPCVDVRKNVRRYCPFEVDGLFRIRASTSVLRFSCSAFCSNETLPIGTWTMPNLSVRNSTLPPFASRTARATSCVTVPDFGFGIRPRGPSTLPSGPTLDMMSGVAIAVSNSVQPSVTFLTRSSPPTTSAPASCASRALSPTANTATRTFLPVPLGSTTEPRTICSAWRGSTPNRMCASTVASNLEIEVSRTSWTATSGSSPPLPLDDTAASTFLAASMYFLPLFFGIRLLHNLEAHRPRGPLDHLHRGLGVKSVQVLALHLDDLAHLLPRDAADLLLVRLGRALVDPRRSLEQLDRGRRLQHERERAVLEDRDERRHDVAGLRSGALVVGLGELHDVDAVRAEGRADRRRRRGLAGLELELQYRADFLLAHYLSICLN